MTKRWDVSAKITGAGDYSFNFQYTRGTHRLDFRKVALLEGDKVLGRDDQPGHTGTENVHTLYRFTVAKRDPAAKYVLEAEIKADGGTDSYGEIFIAKE